MTRFEKISKMDLNELADFFDKYFGNIDGPWDDWFNEVYCQKCAPIVMDGHELAPCEAPWVDSQNCLCGGLGRRFTKDIVFAWLQAEVDE